LYYIKTRNRRHGKSQIYVKCFRYNTYIIPGMAYKITMNKNIKNDPKRTKKKRMIKEEEKINDEEKKKRENVWNI